MSDNKLRKLQELFNLSEVSDQKRTKHDSAENKYLENRENLQLLPFTFIRNQGITIRKIANFFLHFLFFDTSSTIKYNDRKNSPFFIL